MDQLDLRAFSVLARTLHFARSAEELNLSPSAFTRRIQGIEEELQQTLLTRTRRAVSLTPAGLRLLAYCQNQAALYSQLLEELKQEEKEPSGELEIACTITACHSVLPTLLADFRQLYPRINLRLLTQDAARSLEQLKASEIDLAVIPSEGTPQELSAVRLGYTEFTCIAPLETPTCEPVHNSFHDSIKQYAWVAPLGGLERQRLEAWRQRFAPQSTIGAEVRGNEGIIAMVSLGMGIALVPELVLQSSPLSERVRRIPLETRPQGYEISLCSMPRSLQRRAVKLFWQLAEQRENLV